MTKTEIRSTLSMLAKRDLGFEGTIPEGELAAQFDSVQRLTFVVAIEDEFRVCFEPEDEAKLLTLDDLIMAIDNKLTGPEANEDAP